MYTVNDMFFTAPEKQGLDSQNVLKFLEIVKKRKINLHSFMVVRRGQVLVEGYFKPFDKHFKHRIYSATKTFVSLAVGKAIGEGKIKLTDKIADYFPEYPIDENRVWLRETTIEDALKMSVPMLTDTYYSREYNNWGWTFFNLQKDLKPAGTVFNYNTSATFILNVLIEKITGMTFLEYLRPIFDKIGVADDIWCVKSPDGYSWGGSGLLITLRDFAKVGELLMHRGMHKGEQLLPLDYMKKATSVQIVNLYENAYLPFRNSGYGYQVWINEDGWAMYGMGTQLALCFPEKDFLFVCQGDTQSDNDITPSILFDLVQQMLYVPLKETALPENFAMQEKLAKELKNLTLNVDFGTSHSSFEQKIDNVRYTLRPNPMGWKWVQLHFDGAEGTLTYENARGEKTIRFGLGKYVQGTFPETHYYDKQVDVPANRELDAVFIAGWLEESKLLVRNYIIDTNFGNCFMTFSFKGDSIGITMHKRAEFFMDDYQGFAGGVKVGCDI